MLVNQCELSESPERGIKRIWVIMCMKKKKSGIIRVISTSKKGCNPKGIVSSVSFSAWGLLWWGRWWAK